MMSTDHDAKYQTDGLGVNRFIGKPVDKSELLQAISEAINRQSSDSARK
jgi:FixJ family two-component response regulator